MLANEPTFAANGVPDRRPVVVLNDAQGGMLSMRKVSVLPSASAALGWKLYAVPTSTERGGLPEMVGARFAGAFTWMVNEGSEAVAVPSLTVIVMRAEVPTLAVVGVPDRRPVVVLKVAQPGCPWIEYRNVLPSGSLPTGRKL